MKKTQNINIFDITAVAIICAVVILAGFAYFYKPAAKDSKILLTLKTTTPDAALIQNAALSQKEVFFNGVNTAVKVVSVQPEGSSLLISLEAPGSSDPTKYIFNGQRILIGQKVEIHGSYFAQGQVTEVKNEN